MSKLSSTAKARDHVLRTYSNKPSTNYYAGTTIFVSVIMLFLIARAPEIISQMANPLSAIMVVVVSIAMLVLYRYPTKTMSHNVRRCGLVLMVLWQLKRDLDEGSSVDIPINLQGSICIVTGANNGMGIAISHQLYELNCNVIMACQVESECETASEKVITLSSHHQGIYGNIVSLQLNLADLNNVQQFVKKIKSQYQRIDVLVNNEDIMSNQKGLVNMQGIEESFAIMHLGHFALTKWLLDYLVKPVPRTLPIPVGLKNVIKQEEYASRVVYVGFEDYLFGSFDSTFMKDDDGEGDLRAEKTNSPLMSHARARLANVLHAHELQRRADINALANPKKTRRLVTSVIHPGSTPSNFIPFISQHFLKMILRTEKQATQVVLEAIFSNSYLPGSYIDGTRRYHDLQGFRSKGYLENHIESFPFTKDMEFTVESSLNIFSLHEYWFKRRAFISNSPKDVSVTSEDIAKKLWKVSNMLIADHENKNKNKNKKENVDSLFQ